MSHDFNHLDKLGTAKMSELLQDLCYRLENEKKECGDKVGIKELDGEAVCFGIDLALSLIRSTLGKNA